LRIIQKLILPAVAVLSLSGQAFSEEASLRHELLGSAAVTAMYSIDEHTTLIKAASGEDVRSVLGAICSGHKSSLASDEDFFKCDGVFEAARVTVPDSEGQSILIKTEDAQPLAYKNPYIPSLEEVAAPAGGRMEGDYASIDIYQYMYALCKKENGTPAVIVSKRFGKFARYTEVSAEEAFSHLLSSGEGKDPWFFGCEGEKRFIVEKDYQSGPDGENRFYFHPKRGLEWVDYVKAGNDKVAVLETR
jgi:hypothetical protein